jgi:hypothetical protein
LIGPDYGIYLSFDEVADEFELLLIFLAFTQDLNGLETVSLAVATSCGWRRPMTMC